MAFIYKTNEGYKFYIGTYIQVPPTFLLQQFSAISIFCHVFGHDCQTTWQNMEMDTEQSRNVPYRNLKGTIYTSPVQKLCIAYGMYGGKTRVVYVP